MLLYCNGIFFPSNYITYTICAIYSINIEYHGYCNNHDIVYLIGLCYYNNHNINVNINILTV